MTILTSMIITLFKPGSNGSIRYYTIHDRQPLLTARYALTIAWRTGEGRECDKVYGFDTASEMDKKIKQVFRKKLKDGYKLLYSYTRNGALVEPAASESPPALRNHGASGA